MSGERLVASYLVRVTVRHGHRRIGLHVMDRGENLQFSSYGDLLEYFERHDEAFARPSRSDTPSIPGRDDDPLAP